jgi:SAM-dependent methyltransferase
MPLASNDSLDPAYAARLDGLQGARWKRLLDVQRPYRWNLRRLKPGRTLDIGCGVGRNLAHLGDDGVGVDPNPACVSAACAAGFAAYTPAELPSGAFDTLLVSHVLEHVSDPVALIRDYLPRLKQGGRVIVMTPQEAGYRSDPTHVVFLDFEALGGVLGACGLTVERAYSFPFPRPVGRIFKYNEFVVVARKP